MCTAVNGTHSLQNNGMTLKCLELTKHLLILPHTQLQLAIYSHVVTLYPSHSSNKEAHKISQLYLNLRRLAKFNNLGYNCLSCISSPISDSESATIVVK
jgi:hypothetical protein